MKPVVPHPEAEAEFHHEVDYHEGKTEGAGDSFRIAAEAAIEKIRGQPNFYPRYEDTDCRECPVRGFPHAIYYVEIDDYIWVLAFAQQRKKPGYWKRRLKRRPN